MSTDQELAIYRKYFLAQDKSGDGKLNRDEFKQMLKSMGLQFNNREMNKAFLAVDKDKGGTITFIEFANAYLKKNPELTFSHDRVKAVCQNIDKDKDGKLTKEECLQGMRMLGKNLNASGMTRIMQLMDKDQSGGVSYDEFRRFFKTEIL